MPYTLPPASTANRSPVNAAPSEAPWPSLHMAPAPSLSVGSTPLNSVHTKGKPWPRVTSMYCAGSCGRRIVTVQSPQFSARASTGPKPLGEEAVGGSAELLWMIWSARMCAQPPSALSSISSVAVAPLNSATSQLCHLSRSEFSPVAERLVCPPMSSLARNSSGRLPPASRKDRWLRSIRNGGEVSVPLAASLGWWEFARRLPRNPPTAVCPGTAPAVGPSPKAVPVVRQPLGKCSPSKSAMSKSPSGFAPPAGGAAGSPPISSGFSRTILFPSSVQRCGWKILMPSALAETVSGCAHRSPQ